MLRLIVAVCLLVGSGVAQAAGGSGFGLNVGLGAPFMSQAGLNYKMSDRFGMSVGYNLFDLKVGDAGAKLTLPELLLHYHPFGGSYFLAAGIGQETMEVTSTATNGAGTVSIKVEAMATVFKTGWMWGISDGGLWFGMDISFISPSGPKETITAPGVPTTDQSYIDAADAAKKFGQTAFTNLTFARIGYLF